MYITPTKGAEAVGNTPRPVAGTLLFFIPVAIEHNNEPEYGSGRNHDQNPVSLVCARQYSGRVRNNLGSARTFGQQV